MAQHLAPTRSRAQALILAGQVRIAASAARIDKPGTRLPVHTELQVAAGLPYVSRGGLKLAAALAARPIALAGTTWLDVGASTGGFTDCLLQHGAARVHALDVGHNQLAWALRTDPRVQVYERTNVRHLAPDFLPTPCDGVVIDVSFISLTLALPPLRPLLRSGGWLIALVKPQFEAGRAEVGKGGIVRDPAVHRAVLARIEACLPDFGLQREATLDSPISGSKGNREFLLLARRQ